MCSWNREWIFQEDETEWQKAPAQVNVGSWNMGHWCLELGEGITSVLMRNVRILLHRNYSVWTPKCEHRGTTQVAGSISALLCGHWAAVTREQKCSKGQMQTEGVKRHLPLLSHLRPTGGKQKTTLSLTSLAPWKKKTTTHFLAHSLSKSGRNFYLFIYLFILILSHGLWDLSSLTRDWTWALSSDSMGS